MDNRDTFATPGRPYAEGLALRGGGGRVTGNSGAAREARAALGIPREVSGHGGADGSRSGLRRPREGCREHRLHLFGDGRTLR